MYLPDYNDLFAEHDAQQEREFAKLPKCDCCGEPIQDDFLYEINGDLICEECLNLYHRKRTDDYVE